MNATENTVAPTDRDLVLTRVFNAPREKVFKAWTDPELLKQWFAPLPYRRRSPSSMSGRAART